MSIECVTQKSGTCGNIMKYRSSYNVNKFFQLLCIEVVNRRDVASLSSIKLVG